MTFNVNDQADVAALKAEIENDPLGIGYAPANGNTQELLDLINAKNYTTSKPKISSAKVRSATKYSWYNKLIQDEQEWLRWMTGTNGFDEENMDVTTDLRKKLTGATGGGGSSAWHADNKDAAEAAMLALIDVPGGRAEVLWGFGTIIGRNDWFAARDS